MAATADTYHIPVLKNESIDGLDLKPEGVYIDVTFGGGGHSREILARLNGTGHLYSFDQDADAEKNIHGQGDDGKETTAKNFTFVRSNFRYLSNWMRYYGVEGIDGLLADLGVSSHHLDDESRGFSFRFDSVLDMRMNKRAGTTAADVLNKYDEGRLADVFYLYGELKDCSRSGKSTCGETHRNDKGPDGNSREDVRTRKGKERNGETVSGPAHRSEPRNGRIERNARRRGKTAEAGRTPVGNHLPQS